MRHVIDRARVRGGGRLKQFLHTERMNGEVARQQVQMLRRTPKGLDASLRLKRYLRILAAER